MIGIHGNYAMVEISFGWITPPEAERI